jgi:acyl-CoA reductase-like NAD-dependent aldehyde dehydrogenase
LQLRSYNPSTGDLVGEVPITPVESIPDVVARARRVQPAWRRLGLVERARLLGLAGPKFTARADELGELLTREMGKPRREGVGEVRSCGAGLDEDLAEMVEALSAEVLHDGRTRTTVYRDPFGVCAAITPWNFPMSMPHWMVLPALMAGNTVLLKPSEETPLIAQAYADLLGEELPEGVLQVVHGADAQGKALVNADIDLIAFTGSRDAGRHILEAAADGLKRVVLELGGKDPLIVLADADVAAAAKFAARNSFRNAGQVCVSTERIFVADTLREAFESALVAEAQRLPVGDGLDPETRIGPMINSRQRRHVVDQVRDAIAGGAQALLGGDQLPDDDATFLSPIVLTDVDPDLDIMVRETFGPVACVTFFSTEDEAVELANRGIYGLGAVVFGGDLDRAEAVARRLDAGMIGVNRGVGGARGAPWVGAKQSGYGFHSGPEGHRQFAQVRILSTPVKEVVSRA